MHGGCGGVGAGERNNQFKWGVFAGIDPTTQRNRQFHRLQLPIVCSDAALQLQCSTSGHRARVELALR